MLVFRELKMTHSTVLSRDGRPFVAVMIERGKDVAEGTIPECRITRNNGFSSEEVAELEAYLEEHRKEIIEAAKGISSLSNLLRLEVWQHGE